MAGGHAAADLHRLTAGNPFFLTEVLAAPDGGVPATVADAVLARVRRLAPATQRAVDQLAVVPGRCELWLARRVIADIADLAEAEQAGVLTVHATAVGFRHELARRAVEGTLPVLARMALNEKVLAALRSREDPDLDRIVHHAVQAGADDAVVEYAPEAARGPARQARRTRAPSCTGSSSTTASCSPPTHARRSARRTRGRCSTPTGATTPCGPPNAWSGSASSSASRGRSGGRWRSWPCSTRPTTGWGRRGSRPSGR